ncbi:MAG: hypothetical protein GX575_00570 [Candidatus Anammoximicrobium sp.]|nr:hypothetical protein [Candidatus Anammoximicrobium sp.]
MFVKLQEKLKQLAATARPAIDLAQFNDPLAERVEWTPLKSGGASFRTHQLVADESGLGDRLEFRATAGAKLFCGLFLTIGLGVLAGAAVVAVRGHEGPLPVILLGLLGLAFSGIGGGLWYAMTRVLVFDKASGYFWRGRRDPQMALLGAAEGEFTPLPKIHAIQILSERCQSGGKSRSTYYSYELNLVLHDGTRVHVVDHGHSAHLRDDAAALGKFLAVPVWDVG